MGEKAVNKYAPEISQMLDLADKDFKAAIMSMETHLCPPPQPHPSGKGLPLEDDGEKSVKVTITQAGHDANMTEPFIPAETTPSWMVASVLAASVCAALLLLLGCFFLLRCPPSLRPRS